MHPSYKSLIKVLEKIIEGPYRYRPIDPTQLLKILKDAEELDSKYRDIKASDKMK